MNTLITVEPRTLQLVDRSPLDRNPAAVYLAGLSAGSRRTMHQALDVLAGILTGQADALALPWGQVRYPHVAAVRSRLAATYAPATACRMLCALRGALREAWRLEQIPEADYRRAIDVKGVRGETLPAGRALTIGEIDAMLEACSGDPSALGLRDGAMIAVLYACGLRRAEIVFLDLADYDATAATLKIRRAKGNKDRSVPVAAGAASALADWLQFRGDWPGPLFALIGRAGQLKAERLSTQAVYNLLRKRSKQAGIPSLSPHDMRRSLITHLLDGGADLLVVSRIAGHASVVTTARYDRRGEESKRKALELIHVPYRARTIT